LIHKHHEGSVGNGRTPCGSAPTPRRGAVVRQASAKRGSAKGARWAVVDPLAFVSIPDEVGTGFHGVKAGNCSL
jgi:hypothetical protein